MIACPGSLKKFTIENDKEVDMKKVPTPTGSRNRLRSTKSVGSFILVSSKVSGGSGSSNMTQK